MAAFDSRAAFDAWSAEPAHAALTRVALLKGIEAASGAAFRAASIDTEADPVVRQQLVQVVMESNMAGMAEFGPEWYKCISAKQDRMTLCAEWIVFALTKLGDASGFDAFERALIAGPARMLPAYHKYYFDYLESVQNDGVGARLKDDPPATEGNDDIYSSYMVVTLAADGKTLETAPFATHFAAALAPVFASFDQWLAECRAAQDIPAGGDWDAESRANYVAFLQQYRDCLASTSSDPVALEAMWRELDMKWMDTKAPIQIVHDIETGYGDPLRVKATPDMSLRFLDESYAAENAAIADIQTRMMEWYTARDTPLARAGLNSLSNTMAGIYFIPFKTGISLQVSQCAVYC